MTWKSHLHKTWRQWCFHLSSGTTVRIKLFFLAVLEAESTHFFIFLGLILAGVVTLIVCPEPVLASVFSVQLLTRSTLSNRYLNDCVSEFTSSILTWNINQWFCVCVCLPAASHRILLHQLQNWDKARGTSWEWRTEESEIPEGEQVRMDWETETGAKEKANCADKDVKLERKRRGEQRVKCFCIHLDKVLVCSRASILNPSGVSGAHRNFGKMQHVEIFPELFEILNSLHTRWGMA